MDVAQNAFEKEFGINRTSGVKNDGTSNGHDGTSNGDSFVNNVPMAQSGSGSNPVEEEVYFQFNRDDEYSNDDENNGVEADIGFGATDEFDVLEVADYCVDSRKDNENETTEDIIKGLKHGCVSNNSKKNYISNICLFLIYIYKYDRYLLHNSWSSTLDSFTYSTEDENKKIQH